MSLDEINEILEETEYHEAKCEDTDELQCAVIVLREALHTCLKVLKKHTINVVDSPEQVQVGL